VLERCNQDNILALERIIGFTAEGNTHDTEVHRELQVAGALWAEHVLENARAYIMSFFYIVLTVTIGYPLITGIAVAAGMTAEYGFYITRFFDSLIYFFLPQINITLIRLFQKRNLLHRMTGRTVVIGDIPWVSQCADAYLSKIFARSYSIASLNVLSGNPSDHLVHRHTHRVVRGTLLICGRPDGRLTALTSAECSVNLSVNQASSIQSLGGTCESITIGHNPSKLALTKMDIALGTHRPKFLCEQLLDVMDEDTRRKRSALTTKLDFGNKSGKKRGCLGRLLGGKFDDQDPDRIMLNRSSHSLKGAYLGFRDKSDKDPTELCNGSNSDSESKRDQETMGTSAMLDVIQQSSKEDRILQAMIAERNKTSELRKIFHEMDASRNGTIDLDEFVEAYKRVNADLSVEDITTLFREGKDSY
jgi:hypothetical protein